MALENERQRRAVPPFQESNSVADAGTDSLTGPAGELAPGATASQVASGQAEEIGREDACEEYNQAGETTGVSRWSRWPRSFRYVFTLETALYSLILIYAIFTRFYELDLRTLHHDEGVHAWYSWRLFNGQGYAQEPWKHGPFLYHITALVFWIFGDSDQTTRVSTALFGVLTCLLPLGLRKELGRWGALTAGFLLAVSPMFLYFSRFLREDIFVAFATLSLFVCLVRFVDRPRPGWWYGTMLSLALLFCTKEVSFFYLALFGGFMFGWLCWQLAPRLLLITGGYALLALVIFFFIMALYPPPPIPFETITGDTLGKYTSALLAHPVFWSFIILALGGLGLTWFAFHEVASQRRRFMLERGWLAGSAGTGRALFAPYRQDGTVACAVAWLGRHWKVALAGLGMAFAFYFVLFTGFFTDIPQGSVGLFSGLWYWMAQQGVARGNQPWYYYFFMLPLYEPLALALGSLAGVYILVKAFQYGFYRQRRTVLVPVPEVAVPARFENEDELDTPLPAENGTGSEQRLVETEVSLRPAGNDLWPGRRRRERHPYFAPLLLVAWAFGGLAIYTWAAEKMPWLTVQVALPFILLAAYLMDGVWKGLETYFLSGAHQELILWGIRSRTFFWSLVGGLTASAFLLYMTLLHLTSAELKVMQGSQFQFNWLVIWIGPVIALLFFTALFSFTGLRVAVQASLAVAFGLLVVYLLHTGFTYSFDHGDVALEMGIYTQTAPDVYRVVKELDTVTGILPDLKRTPVLYDSELRTPLDFYLRKYTNANRVQDFSTLSGQPGQSLGNYTVLMISDTKAATLDETQKRLLAANYISRHYTFHYWFDESQYRNFDRSASVQIDYLQGRTSQATVKDAANNILVSKGEVMTTERLQQISATAGALDRIYNANGGNATLLHLKEALQSLNNLRSPGDFARLWRYVVYREQIQPLGRREFTLYVKKDIAGLWRQYGDLVDYPISGQN